MNVAFAVDIDELKAKLTAKEEARYALDERLDALINWLSERMGQPIPAVRNLRYCGQCQAITLDSDIRYVVKSRETRDEPKEYTQVCNSCDSKGDDLFEEM